MAYNNTAARSGGIGGILFVVLFLPSYLTPPDAPVPTSKPQDVVGYFADRQDGILLFNGLLLIFATFFSCGSSGLSTACCRCVEGEGSGISSVALGGGLVFIVLVLANTNFFNSLTGSRKFASYTFPEVLL